MLSGSRRILLHILQASQIPILSLAMADAQWQIQTCQVSCCMGQRSFTHLAAGNVSLQQCSFLMTCIILEDLQIYLSGASHKGSTPGGRLHNSLVINGNKLA